MKRFYSFMLDMLGFNKVESNGFIVLVVLVLAFFIIPKVYFINQPKVYSPEDSVAFKQWVDEINASLKKTDNADKLGKGKSQVAITPSELFPFDPNEVSEMDLARLGLSDFVISNLIKYRKAGGIIKSAEDLKSIYGLEEAMYKRLIPFIRIDTSLFVYDSRSAQLTDEIEEFPPLIIELNSSRQSDLIRLKGIGDAFSTRILKYRDLLGGYVSKNQLKEVYGLSEETYNMISPFIRVDSAVVSKMNINTDSIQSLSKHPYIDYSIARAIVNYRKQNGEYTKLADIKKIMIIDDSLYLRIHPYITAE